MNSKTISANIAYINPEDRIIKVDCSVLACSLYFSRPASDYDSDFGVTIKKTDSGANAVTIYPYSGDTIDGSASVTLTAQNDYKTLAPITGGWTVVDAYSNSGQSFTSPTITGGTITPATLILPTGTPVSPVQATGTLTFIGVVSDTETVVIGDDTYEFDTDAEATITEGNIRVDVSGGATASAAVTALVAAITASDTQGVGGADGDGDTVVLTADTAGTAANAIATTTTCANASFGAATLEGGVNGTVGVAGQVLYDGSNIYVSTDTSTVAVSHWESVGIS